MCALRLKIMAKSKYYFLFFVKLSITLFSIDWCACLCMFVYWTDWLAVHNTFFQYFILMRTSSGTIIILQLISSRVSRKCVFTQTHISLRRHAENAEGKYLKIYSISIWVLSCLLFKLQNGQKRIHTVVVYTVHCTLHNGNQWRSTMDRIEKDANVYYIRRQ